MKLYFGALAGVLFVYSLQAQPTTTDPVLAAEEAQRQAQFAFENQLSDLNNSANQAKEGLLAQRNSLNTRLQQCFIQKNEAQIGAEQEAQQGTQQATNQLIQGSMQGLTPLVQNFGTANQMGKDAAKSQKEAAVSDQHLAVDIFTRDCKSPATGLKFTGISTTDSSKLRSVQQQARTQMMNTATGNQACATAAQNLNMISTQAKREIDQATQAESAGGSNTANMAIAAAALGVNYYGYTQAKKGAEDGLDNANRLNSMSYDACQEGVKAEAAELDRQIANIERQLAFDRDRLAKQFAQFKLNMPANIQNKTPLNVEDDEMPKISALGGPVTGTTFKSPENPFGNLGKNGGGDSGGGGGAGGGTAGAGGAGDDGKVGWGFKDPYETNNPGLAYTLPNQPEKAGLIGGADGGEGGGGANPFGEGFMGFEDPFGNLAGAGGAALAEGQGGNGFIELALKTRRRVYAHLNELLGKPNGTKVSKEESKKPERKISSVRD